MYTIAHTHTPPQGVLLAVRVSVYGVLWRQSRQENKGVELWLAPQRVFQVYTQIPLAGGTGRQRYTTRPLPAPQQGGAQNSSGVDVPTTVPCRPLAAIPNPRLP